MSELISLSAQEARRLAIIAQHLDGDALPSTPAGLSQLMRRLRCLQIDPINVVARTPLLVLWSRLGAYDSGYLDQILWQERQLFEYWAHAASIVLTEDFPLHQLQMLAFARSDRNWSRRVRQWLEVNEPFRRYILDTLREKGPMLAGDLEDRAVESWKSSGWTNSRNVSTMLGFLWEQGDITVTRRYGAGFGIRKEWGLLEQHLPQWQDHVPWPETEVVRQAADYALKALGVATKKQISQHFIRGRYPGLEKALAELVASGRVLPAEIIGNASPKRHYLHVEALSWLEEIRAGGWRPKTTLLSPFDNLIADRDRTESLFNFYFRIEIYTPKAKRQYGYYVMPILHGDRLIGRIDPRFDRKSGTLQVRAAYAEDTAMINEETARHLAAAIEDLATFLGADHIECAAQTPDLWRQMIESS